MATCWTVRLVRRLVVVKMLTVLSSQGFPDLQQRYLLDLVPVILCKNNISHRTIGTKVTLSPKALLLLETYGQSAFLSLIFHFPV